MESQRRLRLIWLVVGFIITIASIVSSAWIYLQYSIYQHIYSVKASLDWFNIIFYHNYTFVAAAIFSLLLINPRIGCSDFWRLVEVIRKFRSEYQGDVFKNYDYDEHKTEQLHPHQLSNWNWAVWQFLKWGASFIYFVTSGGFVFVGNVMNSVMMLSMGFGSWSSVIKVFLLPILPVSGNDLINLMPTMEIQYRLIQASLQAILLVFSVRMLLKFFANLFSSTGAENRAKWIGNLLGNLLVAVAALLPLDNIILGAPYWLMDVRTPFIYGIAWASFFFLMLLVVCGDAIGRALADISFARPHQFERVLSDITKRNSVKGAAILLGLILVVQVGLVVFYSMNWNNNYISYEWIPKTQKEITVTRWAAGLNDIKIGSLMALPTSSASTILNLTRQWDQEAASVTMTKEIGAYNWMALASSNIIFVNNTEYWISPTTPAFPSTDWLSEHMIYTHSARMMMINTHSGAEISLGQSFHVNSEPLIYYGEPSQIGKGGFMNNVYINVPGYQEIQNYSYGGIPDYTLTGWQKTLWMSLTEGQIGFALANYPIEMLLNRDVFNRVQSTLIPGLVIDPAAYITSDGMNVYYVLQIYIDYPLQSAFSAGPYLRFFGVVLVNVYDGSLQGYTVSNLLGTNSSDFITSFYDRYYSGWGSAPDWFVPQIRYPEQLLGNPSVKGQLDYDFTFHVNASSTNAFVWKSSSQFYERPPLANVVQYIPWAVGNMTYFVGVQPVSYLSSSSQNLAGLYIAYAGDRLGQIYIYQNPSPSNTFINPNAAENALTTNSMVRTQLTLLPNYRVGSYLLYSVGGNLVYFVAVYTKPGTSGVVTQLPFMTATDPTTGNVGMSSTSSVYSMSRSAYDNLFGVNIPSNNSTVPPANSITLLRSEVDSLISKGNYTLVNATIVSAPVEIRAETVSLVSLGIHQTAAKVAMFIQTYGSKASGKTVYEWIDNMGNLDIGIFESEQPIATLDYIMITLK